MARRSGSSECPRGLFRQRRGHPLIGLARARFDEWQLCRRRGRSYATSVSAHPNSFAQERTILSARAVAAAGDSQRALSRAGGAAGTPRDSLEARRLEARYYYAELLWKQGAKDRARPGAGRGHSNTASSST